MSRPADVAGPHYYHKVVDCQWACPAHTNVPEYIRLIAQGRYTEAYMLNRDRTSFRASSAAPATARASPLAGAAASTASRSRSAGSSASPPTIATTSRASAAESAREKNGKRVALHRRRSGSLTVANDLMPLGYEVVIFEKLAEPGGLMRINIPSFRLPASVLDEEVGLHHRHGRGDPLQLAGRRA